MEIPKVGSGFLQIDPAQSEIFPNISSKIQIKKQTKAHYKKENKPK